MPPKQSERHYDKYENPQNLCEFHLIQRQKEEQTIQQKAKHRQRKAMILNKILKIDIANERGENQQNGKIAPKSQVKSSDQQKDSQIKRHDIKQKQIIQMLPKQNIEAFQCGGYENGVMIILYQCDRIISIADDMESREAKIKGKDANPTA